MGVGPLQISTLTSLTFVLQVLTREIEAVVASCTTTSCGKLPVVTHLVVCSLRFNHKQANTSQSVSPASC